MASLVHTLLAAGMGGWSLWAWLCSPIGLLGGHAPAQVAAGNPGRAQRAARRRARRRVSGGLPPQDLTCPNPPGCPVAVARLQDLTAAGNLPHATPGRQSWFRVYDARDGYGQPNPGYGDTRFAPFDAAGGRRVPTMYLAQSLQAALLETSLHDVDRRTPRVVAENTLVGLLHAQVAPPRALDLVDLRDPAPAGLGLTRAQVTASPPEHYPCTRRVAQALHADQARRADGIVWHSRQAELTGHPPQEVAVIFADRVPCGRGDWALTTGRAASGSLLEGAGRLLLDELAETLGITISPSGDLDDPEP